MVGIILEQHPDRAKLFMQWKQMGWPIMVDSLDLLGLKVVPYTVLIDEAGIVRAGRARPNQLEEFLATSVDAAPVGPTLRPDADALQAKAEAGNAEAQRAYADALLMWGDGDRISRAISRYQDILTQTPGDGETHFHLGVAYRRRYESPDRQDGDFIAAIRHWRAALDADPNHYIWRRRIQQYGPRLDKPYPFYDWVTQARQDISARGETPVTLPVEPTGSEFAMPQRRFSTEELEVTEPDPQARIQRDERGYISVEAVAVPHTSSKGRAARVHVVMRPNRKVDAHWNNEAEDLVLWVRPPAGLQIDRQRHVVSRPPRAVSDEVRAVEFEVRLPEGVETESLTLPLYALYYICEGV
ncbi:MAG: hypothetical protein ACYTGC_09060, partial [Planctomycetota bacterium]